VAVSIHDRWQRILRHSSIALTTYVEVIEAVKRDALDSMGSLFGASPTREHSSRLELSSYDCRQNATVVKTVVRRPEIVARNPHFA
jgi:hypothetical protein